MLHSCKLSNICHPVKTWNCIPWQNTLQVESVQIVFFRGFVLVSSFSVTLLYYYEVLNICISLMFCSMFGLHWLLTSIGRIRCLHSGIIRMKEAATRAWLASPRLIFCFCFRLYNSTSLSFPEELEREIRRSWMSWKNPFVISSSQHNKFSSLSNYGRRSRECWTEPASCGGQ